MLGYKYYMYKLHNKLGDVCLMESTALKLAYEKYVVDEMPFIIFLYILRSPLKKTKL